ncbi:MAG: hypothetical protein ACTTH7_00535 [Treponema sp.]
MRSVWLTVIPVFLFCIVCLAVVVLQMPFIKPFLIYAVSKSWLLQVRRRWAAFHQSLLAPAAKLKPSRQKSTPA